MADKPLVIKKYGNRRLYDTEQSKYITLEDLAQMIKSGRDVQVLDAKTNVDLTKSVLLQIISEEEKGRDLLPVTFLKRMIQLGDSSLKEALQRYLSISLDTFLNAQQEFEQRYRDLAGNLINPMNPMMWMMPQLSQMVGAGAKGKKQPAAPAAPEPAPEPAPEANSVEPFEDKEQTQQQLDEIKKQMAKLQQMMAKLEK